MSVKYDSVSAGDALPARTYYARRVDLVKYAGASGDFNPIHWNERFAASVGLPGVIAHGMLNMGLVARYLAESFPPGARFEEYGVRFRAMVRPGDRISIQGRVASVESGAGRTRATLDLTLAADPSRPAITGRAVVSWPAQIGEGEGNGKA